MDRMERLTEEFKFKFERFLTGCDALEEMGLWNTEEYGEMESFYENDLIGLILRLIAADGEIHEKEAEYLNKTFGFTYTAEELAEFYASCRDAFDRAFDEQVKSGLTLMSGINGKLAEAYKELLRLMCEIITESDGSTGEAEREELRRVNLLIAG